jgi:hypothetical protein
MLASRFDPELRLDRSGLGLELNRAIEIARNQQVLTGVVERGGQESPTAPSPSAFERLDARCSRGAVVALVSTERVQCDERQGAILVRRAG